ncbi:MAG: 3-hydroxyacyl-CoA dehydrogenase family protein, partial [Lautropia sp.]|nr:3-hydroxyacyl-CoA dehydrogenase family protein [Lautropia sp.]
MSNPIPPSPALLQLLDSAGILDTLAPLANACGLHIEPSSPQNSAPGRPGDHTDFQVRLQSVPITANAQWFQQIAKDHIAVRFHLPSAAELVVIPGQSERQVEHAADLLVQLGLQVILSPARPGLLVDRLRHAYFNEGLALLGEGVPAGVIETSAIDAGFRAGPLAMLDDEGLAATDQLYHQTLGCHD